MRQPALDRRALMRGATWSVPAIVLASSAPAFADSLATPCVIPSTWGTWSVRGAPAGSAPLTPIYETGWMRGTTGNSYLENGTATYAPNSDVSLRHGGTFVNRPAGGHADLPAGAFISWANNTSTTTSQFIDITYNFTVAGTATVTLSNQVLLQFGQPSRVAARQTLVMKVTDSVSGEQTVGRVALAREKNGAPWPATDAPHPTTDQQLLDEGFTLVATTQTGLGRNVYDWASNPITLTLPGGATTSRTITVTYTFELHPLLSATGVNDDMAIFPPQVVSDAAC